MYGFSLKKIAEVCGGTLIGDQANADKEALSIVIDSRKVQPGDLFAAFRGEQTDGNAYIGKAFENGAIACITDRQPEKEYPGLIILVEDVQMALETFAFQYMRSIDILKVGITGSVGKTTAKEMIASVLSQRYKVLKTDGNFNNQLGVPVTVSRIQKEHQIAVIEMGVSKINDMDLLGDIVRPDVGVFTSIGNAHLEYLKDLEGVFTEKTKMLRYMPEGALAVVNGDDPRLASVEFSGRLIKCGTGGGNDYCAENIDFSTEGSTLFDIVLPDRRMNGVLVNSFGMHYVYDAMLAAAVGNYFGLTDDEIRAGIAAYSNVGRRGDIIPKNGFVIIDDSYNANPESMKSAIDSMMLIPGRHICVLGDMLELGENEDNLHADIGSYATAKGVDLVYTCGPLSANISMSFIRDGRHYDDIDELICDLGTVIKQGDVVLIKASRGMRFERITEALKKL